MMQQEGRNKKLLAGLLPESGKFGLLCVFRYSYYGGRRPACSQLGSGYDAVDDDASQALPGGEEALVSQPLLDSTASAVFRCTYGCDHGAQAEFDLDIVHGTKATLAGRVATLPPECAAPCSPTLPPMASRAKTADHTTSTRASCQCHCTAKVSRPFTTAH